MAGAITGRHGGRVSAGLPRRWRGNVARGLGAATGSPRIAAKPVRPKTIPQYNPRAGVGFAPAPRFQNRLNSRIRSHRPPPISRGWVYGRPGLGQGGEEEGGMPPGFIPGPPDGQPPVYSPSAPPTQFGTPQWKDWAMQRALHEILNAALQAGIYYVDSNGQGWWFGGGSVSKPLVHYMPPNWLQQWKGANGQLVAPGFDAVTTPWPYLYLEEMMNWLTADGWNTLVAEWNSGSVADPAARWVEIINMYMIDAYRPTWFQDLAKFYISTTIQCLYQTRNFLGRNFPPEIYQAEIIPAWIQIIDLLYLDQVYYASIKNTGTPEEPWLYQVFRDQQSGPGASGLPFPNTFLPWFGGYHPNDPQTLLQGILPPSHDPGFQQALGNLYTATVRCQGLFQLLTSNAATWEQQFLDYIQQQRQFMSLREAVESMIAHIEGQASWTLQYTNAIPTEELSQLRQTVVDLYEHIISRMNLDLDGIDAGTITSNTQTYTGNAEFEQDRQSLNRAAVDFRTGIEMWQSGQGQGPSQPAPSPAAQQAQFEFINIPPGWDRKRTRIDKAMNWGVIALLVILYARFGRGVVSTTRYAKDSLFPRRYY